MSKHLYKVNHRVTIENDFYVWADDENQAWDLVDNGYLHDLNEYEYVGSELGDIDKCGRAVAENYEDLALNPEDKPTEDEE